jgi:predicted nucleic acid-binding protein
VNFLLDTNVVSEWTKPRPDTGVVTWLAEVDEDREFVSVVTLAELRYGIERMPAGARRDRLDEWLSQQVPSRFETRVLPVDHQTANSWGRVMARGQAGGRPVSTMDGFIAATAAQHDLTPVTLNVSDFDAAGIRLINPWSNGCDYFA